MLALVLDVFQFLIGTVKTIFVFSLLPVEGKFQFLIGTVKTASLESTNMEPNSCFNSS